MSRVRAQLQPGSLIGAFYQIPDNLAGAHLISVDAMITNAAAVNETPELRIRDRLGDDIISLPGNTILPGAIHRFTFGRGLNRANVLLAPANLNTEGLVEIALEEGDLIEIVHSVALVTTDICVITFE